MFVYATAIIESVGAIVNTIVVVPVQLTVPPCDVACIVIPSTHKALGAVAHV
jgi:hypothetical protein